MADARRIDVHFHIIPAFYKEAVYAAGSGPAIGRYPDWSPDRALELMDSSGIAIAVTSLAQPGVQFAPADAARMLARRCNEYAAELSARWPRRFGAFALVPMHDIDDAVAEIEYCSATLRFAGACLFASYGDKFLGDPRFDPVLEALNERDAVVFIHPAYHPSSRTLDLLWPGFMMEYLFDTTRAAVNLLLTGALERFPRIRFILAHAGGVLPYFAWRLSVAPMIDPRLPQWPREEVPRGVAPLLVRHRAFAWPGDHGRARHHRRSRTHSVRQRLAFRERARHRRGAQGLYRRDFLKSPQRAAIDRGNALALLPQFA